jgi:superfamily II DNA or RNA helicase
MKVGSSIVATELELYRLGIDIETLKSDLTLPNPEFANRMRFGKGRFYGKVDTHICYLKKVGSQYIVPRYYIGELGKYGNEGRDVTIDFKFRLRDYQQNFWDEHSHCLDESTGILFEAGCGSGKTIMAIYFSVLRGKQSMVLVPTYYLAKQWEQRIKESTDASCVILTAKDSEVPVDRDFTIVTMDLFTCRHLPEELIKNIGHVILDEAHRVGADTYLPILDEVPAKYRTALTATFRRADGVHKILQYHFGTHIKMESRFPKPFVYGVRTGVEVRGVVSKNRKYSRLLEFLDSVGHPYHETESAIEFKPTEELRYKLEDVYKSGALTKTAYHEVASCLSKASEMSYSVVESYLDSHSGRRKTTIRVIQECLDAGRTVLFLSKRKNTLKSLCNYFSEYKPMLIISETNRRSEEDEVYLQSTCPLIFGVTQLAKEGLDIDRLDTLIIHLPMKDTEQAIGRISRLCEGKKFPVCLYLLDDSPITYAVYNNAKKYFRINADFRGERTLQTLKTVL